MSNDLFLNPAGFIDAFIFKIQYGVDPMLPLERAKTILQTPAAEDGAIARGTLTFEVEFACPAAGHTVFDFGIWCKEQPLAGAGNAERAADLDLEVARFFQMV